MRTAVNLSWSRQTLLDATHKMLESILKSCFAALGIFLTGLVIGLAILWIPSALKNAIMPWETKETSHTTQIIEAVTREEQISLLRLGILGEEVKDASTTFYGKDLPWSEKPNKCAIPSTQS